MQKSDCVNFPALPPGSRFWAYFASDFKLQRLITETGTDIHQAAAILRKGGLVAIPTETVYGLAADGLNEQAVLAIFKAKNRPDFDPLILHTDSPEKAFALASYIPPAAEKLARAFWPGPLTLVLPKKENVPYVVTSGLQTVGLRVPDHPLTLSLIREIGRPLAAPSANPFGYISPTEAAHVAQNLSGKIQYILDGGPCSRGIESTIIGFEGDEPVLYRRGSLSKEEIEQVAGPVREKINQSSDPQAPGQLASHYAPRKMLLITDEARPEIPEQKYCLLTFGDSLNPLRAKAVEIISLSETGDFTEAARQLYGALRRADQSSCEVIITAFLPSGPLSEAINDRLKRASHPQKHIAS